MPVSSRSSINEVQKGLGRGEQGKRKVQEGRLGVEAAHSDSPQNPLFPRKLNWEVGARDWGCELRALG